jgi:hypothetical protein
MKHSAKFMSVMALSFTTAMVPQVSAQTQHRLRQPSNRRQPSNNRTPTVGRRVRQLVPRSEPQPQGTRRRAQSSEQAITVVRREEPTERTSNTKGTDVRLLDDLSRMWVLCSARPLFEH